MATIRLVSYAINEIGPWGISLNLHLGGDNPIPTRTIEAKRVAEGTGRARRLRQDGGGLGQGGADLGRLRQGRKAGRLRRGAVRSHHQALTLPSVRRDHRSRFGGCTRNLCFPPPSRAASALGERPCSHSTSYAMRPVTATVHQRRRIVSTRHLVCRDPRHAVRTAQWRARDGPRNAPPRMPAATAEGRNAMVLLRWQLRPHQRQPIQSGLRTPAGSSLLWCRGDPRSH